VVSSVTAVPLNPANRASPKLATLDLVDFISEKTRFQQIQQIRAGFRILKTPGFSQQIEQIHLEHAFNRSYWEIKVMVSGVLSGWMHLAMWSRSIFNHQRATFEMAPPPSVRDYISLDGNVMLMRCLDSISSQIHHQQASERESDAEASFEPSLSEHRNSTTPWTTTFDGSVSCAIRNTEAAGK
jgi:hypothetical protein